MKFKNYWIRHQNGETDSQKGTNSMSGQPMKYRVAKAFKGDGKQYEPGDDWEPSGSKFDEQLISTGYVVVVDERVSTRRDRILKSNERIEDRLAGIDRETKEKSVYAMREQDDPVTWEAIAEIFDVSVSTARRYYEREKERRENGQ
jgi:hypothetical protein